jgi:hypothetical protein
MGNPFLFADRFSGAVVHLTTGSHPAAITTHYKPGIPCCTCQERIPLGKFLRQPNDKMPATANWRRHFD